ncbi:ATP-binding cassette domain-containing protein [Romboutsia ilealis]|uniref:ATP-binding cassette domain-containing protein n=1 Tax=Romboutsia faecis TaxID=2764597 RepID=A0ABR7JLF5_9FIRM|nr:ATP-binding cassette domain-containing protein [Romboutsia faecis]MBC5995730.1 ATP-binding cassette domain-containing protein [Romboutsia faecis]MRN23931.1 ATP-binding cassette domain-containing protein [Romboutsia ilealis]
MIEIKNIFKKYKDRNVVDNVSFNIEKGKITSFIGPNGAGKSTVLGIVTRLISGDGGDVVIEGKNLSDYHTKDLAKKIAILKQSNNISLKLTIRELVGFGRFPHSEGNLNSEDEKYINEAIEYMKLTDIQDKYLDELSGGQRQRAYIAMVIAQNTEYILLDEPLNNLDMSHSVQMMKVLRNLCDDLGKTIVLVMHDINFASCYSDNIVALKNGKIEKVGTTNEIVQKEVLEDIYEMNFDIKEINGNKICVYF